MGEKLGRALLELSTDNKPLDRGLTAAEKRATQFEKKAQIIGRAATAGIIAGVAAGVKMSIDFEKSLSKIVGLVGVNREQVDAWREDLLELAPAVAKGPGELADALFFITSAGLRGEQAMNALTYAAKASTAGLGDTAVVADALTSAMNAYADSGLTAQEATDVLTATVREGKAEADAIAGSIGNVVPLAAQMGVEFDEVGAVFAALTRIGSGVEEAATSLTALFAGLLKPTTDAEEALEDFGMSSSQLRSTLRDQGVLATLQMLQKAFGDNETAMARVFPNIRALRGVLGLVGQDAETVGEIFDSLANSTGATDEAFQVASETASVRLKSAFAKVQVALIQIGDALAPIIILFADFIGTLANVINWLMDVGDWLDKVFAKMRQAPNKINIETESTDQLSEKASSGIQHGGIVSSPGLLVGGSGLTKIAERGPEAVLPLTRTPSGDLGVKAGGGGLTINVNVADSVITDQASAERLLIPVIENAVEKNRSRLADILGIESA